MTFEENKLKILMDLSKRFPSLSTERSGLSRILIFLSRFSLARLLFMKDHYRSKECIRI
jgi:hypothetical protein